jgi:hypothetical protein
MEDEAMDNNADENLNNKGNKNDDDDDDNDDGIVDGPQVLAHVYLARTVCKYTFFYIESIFQCVLQQDANAQQACLQWK